MSNRWEVDLELVEPSLLELDQRSYELVIAAVELLGENGPPLGRPIVDTVVSSFPSPTKNSTITLRH